MFIGQEPHHNGAFWSGQFEAAERSDPWRRLTFSSVLKKRATRSRNDQSDGIDCARAERAAAKVAIRVDEESTVAKVSRRIQYATTPGIIHRGDIIKGEGEGTGCKNMANCRSGDRALSVSADI